MSRLESDMYGQFISRAAIVIAVEMRIIQLEKLVIELVPAILTVLSLDDGRF